jgi:hypothetical protein
MTNVSNVQANSIGGVNLSNAGVSVLAVLDELRRTGAKLWSDAVKAYASATAVTAKAAIVGANSTITAGEKDRYMTMMNAVSAGVGASFSLGGAMASVKAYRQSNQTAQLRDQETVLTGAIARQAPNAGANGLAGSQRLRFDGSAESWEARRVGVQPNAKYYVDAADRAEARQALRGVRNEVEKSEAAYKKWDGMNQSLTGSTGFSRLSSELISNSTTMQTKLEKAQAEAASQLASQNRESGRTLTNTAEATMQSHQKMLDSSTDALADVMRSLNMKG